jgi:hypothetical protein
MVTSVDSSIQSNKAKPTFFPLSDVYPSFAYSVEFSESESSLSSVHSILSSHRGDEEQQIFYSVKEGRMDLYFMRLDADDEIYHGILGFLELSSCRRDG